MNEDLIRDELSKNLAVIETDLVFLKKEHQLHNFAGSKGYVDILATDMYGNYVIIEIKRSRSSSRQTLQEILKYVALLKQNYKAKDSEVRAIIISTNWEELLIPFSELAYQSTLNVTGYNLVLHDDGSSFSANKVLPIITTKERCLSINYEIALFSSTLKIEDYANKLSARALSIGIKDFVITKLEYQEASKIKYSSATCFAFNSLTKEEYLYINEHTDELDMTEDEFENEIEFIDYMEQCILCALQINRDYDTLEAGSPEAFHSMLSSGWKVREISRFGIFDTDPRLTNQMIIAELIGLDGNNDQVYMNWADSSQFDRLIEIEKKCTRPFLNNEEWLENLNSIFTWLKKIKSPFRISINVYSPKSLFDSLYRLIKFRNYEYLPLFVLFIDFYDTNKIQVLSGGLAWNGKETDSCKFFEFITDDTDAVFNKPIDLAMGYLEHEIISLLNFSWLNRYETLENHETIENTSFSIDINGNITNLSTQFYPLDVWVDKNTDLCKSITIMHEKYIIIHQTDQSNKQ